MNRILIVDDETAAIDLLRHALDELDVEVTATTSPGAALQLVDELQPDLIVLDLVMPGIDGLKILRQLRAQLPTAIYLPILVVTGHSDAGMRRAALAAGASDLIRKPFDPLEVALRVSTMLQARALHRYRTLGERETGRAREEFLSRMSHELRTPLNAILGFAQELDVRGRPLEDAENIGQILFAGRRLLDLVDGLLDISAAAPTAVARSTAGPPAPPRDDSGAPSRLFLVLYIEDNLSNLRLMRRVLARRPGLALLHASLGQDGVDWAREHSPDLILLDLHLPDISGYEVLAQLRRDPVVGCVPVVIVTADATTAAAERMAAGGANAVLRKPWDVDQLLTTIDRFVQKAQSTPRSPVTQQCATRVTGATRPGERVCGWESTSRSLKN